MGRKSRRAVYDPSIMDRVDAHSNDISPLDPDPLAFHDEPHPLPEDSYETQETEILDPKLHRRYQAKKPAKGRLAFLATLVTAGILAIVVTTAVLVSKNKNSGSGSSTSGSVSNPDTTSGGGGSGSSGGGSGSGSGSGSGGGDGGGTAPGAGPDRVIPPMPVTLAGICLNGFGIYFNGTETGLGRNDTLLRECQLLCQQGECCNMPPNFDFSCVKNPDNDDTCANYRQACGVLAIHENDNEVLDDPVEIPVPPENLDALCAINQLVDSAGRTSCANACGPAACCYHPDANSCAITNANDCALYAPCQNLVAAASVSDQLTAEIRRACDLEYTVTQQGRMKCRNVCKLGSCCYMGNDGCGKVTSDPNFCAVQYKPCQVLYDGTLDKLEGDNYQSPGQPDEEGQDDFMDDDTNYIVDDKQQEDDGMDDDDFVDDAYANTDGDVNPWGIVQGENGRPKLPPVADLEEECDTETIQDPAKAQNCMKRCKQAQCCLFEASLPQSCLAGNKAKCMEYQRWCGALFGDEDQVEGDLSITAPSSLPQLCSAASLATEDGMDACQQACQVATCCFSWEADTQCRDDTDCPSYAPCLNLQTMAQDNGQVEDAVAEICTEQSVKTFDGHQACADVCMSHVCCWAANQPFCTNPVNQTCGLYDGCKYLRQGQDFSNPVDNSMVHAILPAPPENLTDVCSLANFGDAEAKAQCQSICKVSDCCDLPENLQGSCLKGNHLNCLRYHRACSTLVVEEDNNSITVTEAPPDLVAWCSAESLGTEFGLGKCKEECNPYQCCWSDATGIVPCRTQANCEGYNPCMGLNAADTVDTTIENEVNATCTEASVQTPKGLAVCQQVCLDHRCCWDVYDDAVEKCFGNEACAQYSACTMAHKDTETDDTYAGEGDGFYDGSANGGDRKARKWLRK
jgi:hypothetical protein